jgi:hypothetical protein
MKKLLITLSFYLFHTCGYAQNTFELVENIPINENGLNIGYTIVNEKNKSVKGEDFDRFEIELFVTNKSGANKIFPFKINKVGQIDETDNYILAEFKVKNATGKRLTSKGAKVEPKAIRTLVKIDERLLKNPINKGLVEGVIGYGISNNESVRKTIIVILPKGEKPNVICNTFYLPE